MSLHHLEKPSRVPIGQEFLPKDAYAFFDPILFSNGASAKKKASKPRKPKNSR